MLTAAACSTLSRTAVLNKSVATLRLARSFSIRGNLPAPASGTCRYAGVEPCRGPRTERTELAGYKLYQTAAAIAACVPEAQGGQRRNAALSLHGASEVGGIRIPIAARLAHNSSEQVAIELRPAELPKKTLDQATKRSR
jgi:hypothetical protein